MSEPDDVLDPEKWIGKGRTFPAKPEDVPRELSLYCDHLLEIPGNFQKNAFPNASTTVEKFLQLRLLEPSFDVVHAQANHCFHQLHPNDDPISLLIRPIPSRGFIENLRRSYGQAVLNGNNSVEDPTVQILKAVTSLAGRTKKSQVPDNIDEEFED